MTIKLSNKDAHKRSGDVLQEDGLTSEQQVALMKAQHEGQKLELELEKHLQQVQQSDVEVNQERWKLILETFQAIKWPLFFLALLLFYGGSIGNSVNLLIERIREADRISWGNFEVELRKLIKDEIPKDGSNDEVESAIDEVSANGIKELTAISAEGQVSIVTTEQSASGVTLLVPTSEELTALAELERLGLVTATVPIADVELFLSELKPQVVNPLSTNGQSALEVESLSAEDTAVLEDFSYQLTSNGKVAANAINSATSKVLYEP